MTEISPEREKLRTSLQSRAYADRSVDVLASLRRDPFIQGRGLPVTRSYSFENTVYNQDVLYDTQSDFEREGVTDLVDTLLDIVGGSFDVTCSGRNQEGIYTLIVSTTSTFEIGLADFRVQAERGRRGKRR